MQALFLTVAPKDLTMGKIGRNLQGQEYESRCKCTYRILLNTHAGANTKISRGVCVFKSNYI